MVFLLIGVGALSVVVLGVLGLGLARRLGGLSRSLSALQSELVPAVQEIERATRTTRRLAERLEERARPLRRDDG